MDRSRLQPPQASASPPSSRRSSRPSVGLRRLTSSSSFASNASGGQRVTGEPLRQIRSYGPAQQPHDSGRRRSSSEPQRPTLSELGLPDSTLRHASTRPEDRPATMPPVAEGVEPFPDLHSSSNSRPTTMPPVLEEPGATTNQKPQYKIPRRPVPNSNRSFLGLGRRRERATSDSSQAEYDENLVNLLDVIDPEVSTLSTLTNVQNSLFIPDLSFLNRRPTYNVTPRASTALDLNKQYTAEAERIQTEIDLQAQRTLSRRRDSQASITSELSESRWAVLPHGVSLEGWTEGEKEELNDHVRHLLHSRRAAFRRSMKGFGQYVRRPMGLFVTVYATLITLFGAAWVFFLIGWISIGAKQLYVINVIDNILVALFAIMGDGLIPFRIVDTYHMIFIAHYHHLTWRIRQKKHLPKLPNHNDLPDHTLEDPDKDLEDGRVFDLERKGNYYSVLTEKQQKKLEHHQNKFSKSHTFYKPHETETHFAFPLRLLVAIVVLLDCHSIFQVALGTFTWTHEDYNSRPFAVTTAILCCSITVNILGGVLISVGDHKTRKKDVKERMFRQQLTEDAMQKIKKRRDKEAERNYELDEIVTPEH